MRHVLLVGALVLAAATLASTATASQLIIRNASAISLSVNAKGEAMVTYRVAGKVQHVLAWGAVNAIAPTRARAQVKFNLDYSGGYGKYKKIKFGNSFGGSCKPYTGPPLAWKVTACTAPDGSFWALQKWQRMLGNYGVASTPAQSVWELRLSHWTGDLPVLTIATDWAWHQWDHLYGTYTYDGKPVFGYKATPAGLPLDSFGRNVYIDTFDSAYGKGWKRENSFLTHTNTGVFCYSFNPHGSHAAGKGTEYRATVEGPGVTPDVMWQGAAPGPYDKAADAVANEAITALGDKQCRAN